MTVIIGVDPHKATHTAVANCRESANSVHHGATKSQATKLLVVGRAARSGGRGRSSRPAASATSSPSISSKPARTSSTCRHLLPSRIRVLATRRSNKNDPNDALLVAIAAL